MIGCKAAPKARRDACPSKDVVPSEMGRDLRENDGELREADADFHKEDDAGVGAAVMAAETNPGLSGICSNIMSSSSRKLPLSSSRKRRNALLKLLF